MIDPAQLELIKRLPLHEQEELLRLVGLLDRAEKIEAAQKSFIDYMAFCWDSTPQADPFVSTAHHRSLGRIFDAMLRGELNRVIINMPPRVGKSIASSLFLPSYYLGRNPKHSVIQATHTAAFSVEWGEKVRDLVSSSAFREVFPNVSLKGDNKAKGHWKTNHGGSYYAVGVGGAMVGRNADLLIIDDPHALEINTPIPTPRGFIPIGDLRVGDEVFGPDGKPTKVTAKSDVLERPLFELITDDGASILCDGGHLWSYRSDTKLSSPHHIATARDLSNWNKSSKPCLPRHEALQYDEADLPIDPWVLGAWLGDGTSSLGRMTAHPDDAQYMKSQFALAGYQLSAHKDEYSFGVLGLRAQLISLNLLNNKHIPDRYLTASVAQRMALLQGLMDTDGDVDAFGGCHFNNTNRALVEQVRELLHGLGLKARVYEVPRRRDREAIVYRISFKLLDAARMPRKRARTKNTEDKRCRSFEIRETDRRGLVQCITVEREDGLFLAGRECVVTHNSEQDGKLAAYNPEVFERTYQWYLAGPRQRFTPRTKFLCIQTRWGLRDLTGRILSRAAETNTLDEWKVLEFPAIFPDGKWLNSERFPLDYWLGVKAEYPASYWNSVYQQQPTSEEGALVKRAWWKPWEQDKLPECKFILQSWDTAYLKTQRSDFCACTTWGVFDTVNPDGKPVPAVILLDSYKERLEFPELKATAKKLFMEKKPDTLLIEAKAAGAPLASELRMMGIPVSEFTPSRGNDKIARVNAISDLFKSGWVYFLPTRNNEEVIEEFAAFPSGEHDDFVDSGTQALLRFRQGGFIKTQMDYDYEEDEDRSFRRRAKYY